MASHGLVVGHLSVRLDAVFQTVELPAGVSHLDTSLAHVDGDAFTLDEKEEEVKRKGGGEKERGEIQGNNKVASVRIAWPLLLCGSI